MKPKFHSPFLAVSVCLCLAANAADVTSVASGFWTTAATWSDATAPATGNNYLVTSGFTVDSPDTANAATLTFGGDGVTVQPGGILRLRHTSGGGNNTHTVNLKALTLDAGSTFQSYNTSVGNVGRNLTNNITLAASGTVNLTLQTDNSGAYSNTLRINGALSGGADLNVTGQLHGQSGERRLLYLNKANNSYTGNWKVEGLSTTDNARRLYLVAEQPEALGFGAVTLNTRSQLRVIPASSMNNVAGVTLSTATSTLQIQGTTSWNNASAFLTNNGGAVSLPDAASSIGNLSGTGGTIQGTGLTSALTVNQTVDGSFNGILGQTTGNTLSLTKTGAAKLTLGGANTYAGATTLSGGSLAVTGSLPSTTALTMAAGDVSLGNGGTTLANQTIASLAQSSGNLLLDVTTASADHLTTAGDYTHTGGGIVVQIATQPTLDTPYTLVTYGGALSAHPPVSYTGLGDSRLTGTVDYGTGAASAITVTFSGDAADLVWSGSPDNVWNINSTQNWTNNANPDKFFQYDNVTFDDTGAGGTILLSTSLSPGTVTFNNASNSYVLGGAGSLTGATKVIKSGAGIASIATDNTYAGGTTIHEGTLRVGNGGTSGNLGSGAVENNAALVFNRSDTFTFANLISGVGVVEQMGSGTTILTADNTYAGSTTISAGTLQVGNGGATGAIGAGAVVNNGTLAYNRSGSVTLAAEISGSGGLTQMGPGTLILEADETYTGPTLISAGRLQLGSGGTTGTIYSSPTITNNGELALNHLGNLDFPQVINGSGSVTQAGAGTLRLTGANGYTGETRLESGTILLDTGSDIPAGGAIAFTGGSATLDLSDKMMSVGGLRLESGITGTSQILGVQSLNVTDNDLVVGTTATANVTLDIATLPVLVYNVPTKNIVVGARVAANNGNSTLNLPGTTYLTAAALNIQTANGSNSATSSNISSGTVNLGAATTLNVNSITLGTSGRDNGTIAYTAVTDPTLTIRAADGVGRTNITLGAHTTAYGINNTALIDLTSNVTGVSTLDALVGTLRIGDYTRGSSHVSAATFQMGQGTLDATTIDLGSIDNNNGNNGTLNSTFSVDGGTVKVGTLNFGKRVQGVQTATFNLNGGGTLSAQTITSGTGTGTRVLNWNLGVISNLAGQNLSVGGAQVNVPIAGSRTLSVEAGHSANFGAGSAIAFDYDSSTLAAGSFTVSGNLVFGTGASLVLRDTAATVTPLVVGTKLTLINYPAGTVTGTFNGIPDGGRVTLGAQPFVIDYDDTSGGAPAVTLTAVEPDPFVGWINSFTALTNPADKTKDADPDHDGVNNLAEFAFNSDPTNPSDRGKTAFAIGDVFGENSFTLTVAMRAGAALDPADLDGGELAFVKDGITYRIQGSGDLATWTKDIGEVAPNSAFIGDLTIPDPGWEYRTFRATGTVSGAPAGFLRVKLEGGL